MASVPEVEAGVGSAMNDVNLRVGGALVDLTEHPG